MPLFMLDLKTLIVALRPSGLSGRVLTLTVGVVLIAEALIVAPTLANFRTQWFTERVEAAQLASLAVAAADETTDEMAMISPALRAELLENAEVRFIRLERDDVNELVLAAPDVGMTDMVVDLNARSIWSALADACRALFIASPDFIRVRDKPRLEGGQLIEIVVPGEALDRDFWRFARRILLASLAIVVVAGAMVYGALVVMFVRPMRRLAQGMVAFRARPEDPSRVMTPSGRVDEIGQAEVELAAMQSEIRQALAQKDRLASLGAAVAKINHDLRNVLTAAQLMSDRLAASRDPKTRGQGERLVRAIGRGVRLAEDVLQYGRAEERAPDPTAVALRAALEDAFADAAAVADGTTGVDITVAETLAVYADPDHIHRIFVNLMRNAVQAMVADAGQKGPRMIGLATRGDEPEHVDVLVSDQGPGVLERARQSLFEPFGASTRKGGSGLGLSICRELARANGGDVWLDDPGERGACFVVRLPRADARTGRP